MEKKLKKGIFCKGCLITFFLAVVFLTMQTDCSAETFFCSSNPDYFTKRCTIHPYAISKVIDGVLEKGHLVGCQFKSYTCMKVGGKYECRDNFGVAVIPFDFSMNDLKRFCSLLCTTPSCASGWE